ncbi:FtsK/SpoIIIE family DNA translocase [Euryhalocaulis caribicus]|uniref:FtsK/SpoIIIE family DNA translocase n=1 Tax=Euryhalocaulis caribicus TaxID=1161401 RepID=UPI0003A34540|nr:DNA translocase FtsK 4TM domain-containing protein [Euryhalocaulis caribicus]
MAAIDASQSRHETPAGFLRARLREITGLLMFGPGAFCVIAALFHAPADPSWNIASSAPIHNPLGWPGAVAADIQLQWLGWAGPALAAMTAGWGALIFAGAGQKANRWTVLMRIVAGILFAVFFAAAVSALPIPANWPFAAGLGGVIGDAFYFGFASLVSPLGETLSSGVVILFGLMLATIALFLCFGVTAADLRHAMREASRAGDRARGAAEAISSQFAAEDDEGEAPEKGRAVRRPGGAAAKPAPEKPARKTTVKTKIKKPAPSKREEREAQPVLPLVEGGDFELPRLDYLTRPAARSHSVDERSLSQNAELLENVLSDFGVDGQVGEVRPGPVVTLYEFEPAPGVKSSRVINLADDVARSMSATSARIAVIPGRNAIGIELPNRKRETVFLRALMASSEYEKTKCDLPLALGETIEGEPFVADLARMPHLLIAGTTGSGKSVGINSMILSLLYRLSPEQCRFIMIDPKMLELSVYDGIPHLLSPVVTDPKKAVTALKWTVREMENRYRKMAKLGVRSIDGFNARVAEAMESGETLERTVQTGYDRETGQPIYETEAIEPEPMPFIVVVIDEMADLMLVAGKDIEGAVQRLAQMARAAGIHMITATQRPSTDVITGVIKANFPSRISFSVSSKIDSRVILGEQGAEQLLGQGDLLFMPGGGRLRRLHGPFVSDREVERIAKHLKSQAAPDYLEEVTEESEDGAGGGMFGLDEDTGDELYDKAVAVVARDGKASTSYIQRRLSIGYNRAATLIEQMEEQGVIGPADHAGRREIFVGDHAAD